MSQFQLIECMVALAGDPLNIVHRASDTPVSYPEMLLLQYLHGDDSVTDAHELGHEERDNADELARLRVTYGAKAVTDVFPGARPRLPAQDTRIKPRKAVTPPKRKPAPVRGEPEETDPELELPEPPPAGA